MDVFGDNRGDPILVASEILAFDGTVSGVPVVEAVLKLRMLDEPRVLELGVVSDADHLSDVNR